MARNLSGWQSSRREAPCCQKDLNLPFYPLTLERCHDRQLKEENENEHGKLTHRCGTSRMEVKRRARRQVVRHSFAGTTRAASHSREKPPDLSVGTSCSGERRTLAAARHWRTASPGIRRNVHYKTG